MDGGASGTGGAVRSNPKTSIPRGNISQVIANKKQQAKNNNNKQK